VILGAVITTAELEPDRKLGKALCLGEQCGRCLLACPGDAVGRFELDLERCRPYSSPYGYHFLKKHVERILSTTEPGRRHEAMRDTDTLMIWQSMLRGVGIYSGCTRCYDVCPVGGDYETHLRDVQENIPEETGQKRDKLASFRDSANRLPPGLEKHSRWIGRLA
jgi:epoxyqueuosine reductase QueG